MRFKTYNQNGTTLLDSQTPVFTLIHTSKLTRLLATPFEQHKREYWYRAKRMGFNSKMRQGWADIHTKEYCMYYLDVPNTISPVCAIYYDGLAKDCEPVVFLNTGQFEGKTRLMFYSNGRLSDDELGKYHIYVFDMQVQKETQVGVNLYNKNGKVTFSNANDLLNLNVVDIGIDESNDPVPIVTQEMLDLYQGVKRLGEALRNEHGSHLWQQYLGAFHGMVGRLNHLLYPNNKSVQQKLDDVMTGLGLNKDNHGYLKSVSHKVAGFGVLKLPLNVIGTSHITQGNLTGFIMGGGTLPDAQLGSPIPTIKTSILLAVIGCQDGLYICPTVDFDKINTAGSRIDAIGGSQGYLGVGDFKCHYVNAQYL